MISRWEVRLFYFAMLRNFATIRFSREIGTISCRSSLFFVNRAACLSKTKELAIIVSRSCTYLPILMLMHEKGRLDLENRFSLAGLKLLENNAGGGIQSPCCQLMLFYEVALNYVKVPAYLVSPNKWGILISNYSDSLAKPRKKPNRRYVRKSGKESS